MAELSRVIGWRLNQADVFRRFETGPDLPGYFDHIKPMFEPQIFPWIYKG